MIWLMLKTDCIDIVMDVHTKIVIENVLDVARK